MRKTIRSIFAVIVGFVAAGAVMMLIEMVNGRVLYPELGKLAEGVTDRDEIRSLLTNAPVGALLVVLLGWVLASLVGGFLAAWIGSRYHALILPVWFWIPNLVIFLPCAYAGARLVARTKQATS